MALNNPPDDTFDPWTASAADAAQRSSKHISEHGKASATDTTNPSFRRLVARSILRLKDRELTGPDVLHAVDTCMAFGLVVPPWLKLPFNQFVVRACSLEARTWDEVFGGPLHPKGSQLASQKRKRALSQPVFKSVVQALLISRNRAIDKGLFEEVGAEHGVGATYAEECYTLAKDFYGNPRDLLDTWHKPHGASWLSGADGTLTVTQTDFFDNPVK